MLRNVNIMAIRITEMHNRKGHAFWAHPSEFELYRPNMFMKVE